MPIDFHDPHNQNTYTTREAESRWIDTLRPYLPGKSFTALDLGCGGGIYSKALKLLGATKVIGMDYSASNLVGAEKNCKDYPEIEFKLGDASRTGLIDQSVDVILERALIHHIKDLDNCFAEAKRILSLNGLLVVQDRTPEDCLIPGDRNHIRGFFFEKYPRLIQQEISRRYTSAQVKETLAHNNFELLKELEFWETREVYSNSEALYQDIRGRTGRSILHELSDEEIEELIVYIDDQCKGNQKNNIVEHDRWTIWIARSKLS